ncbi:MAG TPA: hypothetical protein VFU43_11010 [Streptosporangiaceae bacterium]|nr:hypothetical protein [Streptosporangiaceae bacterium]
MADAADYTDPHLHTYRPVPAAGTGVCRVCHSGPNPGFDICRSCAKTVGQVGRATLQVVPITLYEVPSQLWHVLRHYKDAPPQPSRLLATQVAAIIARFLERHSRCLATLGGAHTLVTAVPSTQPGRGGEHPLVRVVRRVRRLDKLYVPALVRGPGQVGHNMAGDDVFRPVRRVDGHRVLLIDDTFTTGARVQSATSALFAAGAADVVALVVGRVIDPDWNDNCRRIWDHAARTQFTFDRCCLCDISPDR